MRSCLSAPIVFIFSLLFSASVLAVPSSKRTCAQILDPTAVHTFESILEMAKPNDYFGRQKAKVLIAGVAGVTQDQKLQIAKLIEQGVSSNIIDLDPYELDEQHRYLLFKDTMKKTTWKRPHFLNLPQYKLNPEHFQEIVKEHIGQHFDAHVAETLKLPADFVFAQFRKRIVGVSEEGGEAFGPLGGNLLGEIHSAPMLSTEQRNTLMLLLLDERPEDLFEVLDQMHFEDESNLFDIKKVLQRVSAKYPGSLKPEWIEMLTDRVKKKDVIIWLVNEVVELAGRRKKVPTDSLDLVFSLVGLPPEGLPALKKAKPSSDLVGTFYELSRELEKKIIILNGSGKLTVRGLVFEKLRFAEDLWSTKDGFRQFVELVSVLRDLFHFKNGQRTLVVETAAAWDEVLTETALLTTTLSKESIGSLLKQAKELRLVKVRDFLDKSDSPLQITTEQVDELEKRWKSLEPIYTLMARFSANSSWEDELPVLGKMFQAVLADKFKEFKFSTARQLTPMNKAHVRGWIKIKSRLAVFKPDSPEVALKRHQAAHREAAQSIIQTNLLLNLSESARHPDLILSGDVRAKLLDKVLNSSVSPSPKVVLAEMRAASVAKPKQALLATLVDELSKTSDTQQIQKLARFVKDSRDILKLTAQTVDDLDSILKVFRAQTFTLDKPAIVYTSTFWHPKMLLTVGGLVCTGSCQNHQTGQHIETLLGYTIDANVQGVGSFVLTPTSFESAEHFDALFAAIDSGEPVSDSFDPVDLAVRFKFNGHEFSTVPLEHANMRQMMKMGVTADGKVAVHLERPYEQLHAARDVMLDNAEDILEETAKVTGGVARAAMTVPESENTGGVYSDLAIEPGVKTSAYSFAEAKRSVPARPRVVPAQRRAVPGRQ